MPGGFYFLQVHDVVWILFVWIDEIFSGIIGYSFHIERSVGLNKFDFFFAAAAIHGCVHIHVGREVRDEFAVDAGEDIYNAFGHIR